MATGANSARTAICGSFSSPPGTVCWWRPAPTITSGVFEMCIRDRLKGVDPKDFCCWHYWGKSSAACFLGGIRLRGADPASFRVLNFAYAMDKTAVYTTSGRVPEADLASFQVLDNGQNDSGAPQGYAKDSRQDVYNRQPPRKPSGSKEWYCG